MLIFILKLIFYNLYLFIYVNLLEEDNLKNIKLVNLIIIIFTLVLSILSLINYINFITTLFSLLFISILSFIYNYYFNKKIKITYQGTYLNNDFDNIISKIKIKTIKKILAKYNL